MAWRSAADLEMDPCCRWVSSQASWRGLRVRVTGLTASRSGRRVRVLGMKSYEPILRAHNLRARLCGINPTEGLPAVSLMRIWRAIRAGLAACWRAWHADGIGDALRRAERMQLAEMGDAELDQRLLLFRAEARRRGLL